LLKYSFYKDGKTNSRVPISSAEVAKLLETMGVDRVVAIDLHSPQIQVIYKYFFVNVLK